MVAPEADVPACPGWKVKDLVAHLGGVHSWARAIVGGSGPKTPLEEPSGNLAQWYADQAQQLLAALRASDPASAAWSFSADRTVGFWLRRQPHETEMHRIDLALANGEHPAYDPALAADGVSEVLDVMIPRRHATEPAAIRAPIRLLATDTGDSWLLRPSDRPGFVDYTHSTDATGADDVAVTAESSASDLVTGLWRRTPYALWAIDGDQGVLDDLISSGITP